MDSLHLASQCTIRAWVSRVQIIVVFPRRSVMKMSSFAVAMLTVFAIAAPAFADVQFRGKLQITSTSPECSGSLQVGWGYETIFHPMTVSGAANDRFSSLTMFFPYFAWSLAAQNADFGSNPVTVENKGIDWGYFVLQDGVTRVGIPDMPTISKSRQTIQLNGTITDPFARGGTQASCNAGFTYAGVKE